MIKSKKYSIDRITEFLRHNTTPFMLLPKCYQRILNDVDDTCVYANIMGDLTLKKFLTPEPHYVYTLSEFFNLELTFSDISDILRYNIIPYFMLSEYERIIIRKCMIKRRMIKNGNFMKVNNNHVIDEMSIYRIHEYLKIEEYDLDKQGD